MSLQNILSNHLPTCAIETFNGSTTCTCGIETARAEFMEMETKNELFEKCLLRALTLFRKSHPETNLFPTGADNFAWLFERIEEAKEVIDCRHETAYFLDEQNGVQRHKCTAICGRVYWTITVGITTYEVKNPCNP
jgi:hypothetical protein